MIVRAVSGVLAAYAVWRAVRSGVSRGRRVRGIERRIMGSLPSDLRGPFVGDLVGVVAESMADLYDLIDADSGKVSSVELAARLWGLSRAPGESDENLRERIAERVTAVPNARPEDFGGYLARWRAPADLVDEARHVVRVEAM